MRLRNNIFAAAFDELKRHHGIRTQKKLAQLMGVSEDTITRILRDRQEVTEDIITKLQTASGCIFNLQWLRGEDTIHMLQKDLIEYEMQKQTTPQESTIVDLYAKLIQEVESIRRNLNEELDAVRELRAQLSEDVKHLHFTSVLLSHMSVPYPEQPNEHLRAADPELT